MKVHELFKLAQDRYGIRGKELAPLVGITVNHLSEFRSGKTWLREETFTAMLTGMDELAPGSRRYFCQLLAEESVKEATVGERLVQLIDAADNDEMEQVILAIGRKWKRCCSYQVRNEDFDKSIAV